MLSRCFLFFRLGYLTDLPFFGISLGLASVRKLRVVDRIRTALEYKTSTGARICGLLAVQHLVSKMGRLFEPYVIQLLPLLLSGYSDTNNEVRDATQATARAIMASLSDHGVRLILPSLLKGLDDESWRTKQGSVQLLSAMAFCAPRQLSACLPAVVPKLSDVLIDTHPKVRETASTALKQVGSVIQNPEVQKLVPMMLDAIADASQVRPALDAFVNTSFVHELDAASLSLIVPTICRALRDRTIETKRRGAQVSGNLPQLAGNKELGPYLPMLMPQLKQCLVDPIPEVRTAAAKALGTLVSGMGEEMFPDLIDWLLMTLQSPDSSVERSGAAHGLSEVLSGLPIARFELLVPQLCKLMQDEQTHSREGALGLFIFLPPALGDAVLPYLATLLPGILAGLADEADIVRDVALRASRMLIARYAHSALELLLPTLQESLFHDNWRIRQSAVQLVGELLYHVASRQRSERNETEEEPQDERARAAAAAAAAQGEQSVNSDVQMRAVMHALGSERRSSVLSALYVARWMTPPLCAPFALQSVEVAGGQYTAHAA